MSTCLPRPLFINLARDFGGAEVRVLDLARAYYPRENMIACLEGSPLAQKANNAGLRYTPISASKADPRITSRLARLIGEGQFTLVDVHNVQSLFWTYPLLRHRKRQAAFVATVHSSIHMEQKNCLKGALYHTVARTALPYFDQIITVSQFLCNELADDGIPPNHIQRVPNGVQFVPSGSSQRQPVRAEFNLPPDAPLIGAVGRLEPAKGLDILMHALAALRTDFPAVKCLVVGSGSQSGSLHELVRRLGLQQQVIFAGFRSDIHRLLTALDVYVLPSRTEGIPFSLLEAASAGLACVASRVGGVPEILQDELTGLLIEPENPTALVQAITRLLRDPALAQQLGQAAQRDVPARYTIEKMVVGTHQAYCAAIAARQEKRR